MPYVYDPLQPEDHQRMADLNIMVTWQRPKAHSWSIDHETGDFLVRIGPDPEYPNRTWYAFWWRKNLYRVALDEESHPASPPNSNIGYVLKLQAFTPARHRLPDGTWTPYRGMHLEAVRPRFTNELLEAVEAQALYESSVRLDEYRARMGLPPLPDDAPPINLLTEFDNFESPPFAVMHVNFADIPA